jgi:tRNA nucleotidyltransferase/poly(A) polymerase
MKIQIPIKAKEIIDIFKKNNFEIYIVGGAVRDILMGKIVYDWDFATNATPEEMLKILKKFDAYYTNEFGTVGIPSDKEGERPFEITTFRTEHGYSDARRPDNVKWGKTLEEDLERRDFTINALALERESEKAGDFKLVDLFKGRSDLKNKLIRAVGNPNQRFSEDALRMMRAIRIAAELNFKIEEKTLKAITKNKKLIHKISKERVRDELLKTLSSPHPYEGIVHFKETSLMEEIIPEMMDTFGVEQKSPGRHHIFDVGTHSLNSLREVAKKNEDPIVRFATLIHDIGKAKTYKKLKNGTITFYNPEVVSGRIAKDIAKRLKFSKKQSDKFYRLVRYHQFTVNEKQTDSALRRFLRKVGLENVPDILDLRVGDRLGGGARETSWRLEEFKKRLIEVQKQPFTVHDLKITGHDVMKELSIKPGPKVGEILEKLFKEVEDKKIQNEKTELLERLKSLS